MAPRRVGVREAKANLSALLRDVSNGADIVITDHNRPVARLVAIEVDRDDIDAQIARAERLGIIGSKPTGRRRLPPPLEFDGEEEGWAQRLLRQDRDAT